MNIDTNSIPKSIFNADLPTPNVYFVTVQHITAAPETMYVAADTSGQVVQKVRNHFRHEKQLALYRSNSDIKMRRFRLGDYLECPQGLQEAGEVAAMAHERDTVAKLATRQQEVAALVAELTTPQEEERPSVDWAALEAEMGALLRAG